MLHLKNAILSSVMKDKLFMTKYVNFNRNKIKSDQAKIKYTVFHISGTLQDMKDLVI